MSYITFLTNNLALDADVSVLSGGENSQFPLSNIQHTHTTKVFRSTSNTSEILIDLHVTTLIDSFAMVGSTTEGIGVTTVTLYASATTDFSGSTPITIDISPDHNFGFKLFDAGGSYRFWKISMSATAGYCELSKIYLGPKTQLIDNTLSGPTFSYSRKDNSKISVNSYGQRFIDMGNTLDTLSGTVKYADSSEFDTLNNIYRDHGESTPLWFITDPDGTICTDSEFLFSGYFYITKSFDWKSSGPGVFDVNIVLGEAT